MSYINVGKWCGYCGKWVNDYHIFITDEDLFLSHLDACEATMSIYYKKIKEENDKRAS